MTIIKKNLSNKTYLVNYFIEKIFDRICNKHFQMNTEVYNNCITIFRCSSFKHQAHREQNILFKIKMTTHLDCVLSI